MSKATLWELAIKHKTKKFPHNTAYLLEGMQLAGFSLLDIDTEHLKAYDGVRLKHKNPFDVLLLAQASAEDYVFVSADAQLIGAAANVYDARL